MFSIGRRKDDKLQFDAWSSTSAFWENKTSYQAGTCPMGAIFCEVSYRGSFKDRGPWQIGSAAEVRGASARPPGSHTRV